MKSKPRDKLLKTSDKENNLNSERRKQCLTQDGKKDGNDSRFLKNMTG